MADLQPVDDSSFQTEVLDSDLPVLVDFTATWCGPCKSLKPKVLEVAAEFDGRVRVVALDVDKARATAMKYRVMSVPTLLLFRGGQVAGQLSGNVPKGKIVELVSG